MLGYSMPSRQGGMGLDTQSWQGQGQLRTLKVDTGSSRSRAESVIGFLGSVGFAMKSRHLAVLQLYAFVCVLRDVLV